jgi:hypothetical protein
MGASAWLGLFLCGVVPVAIAAAAITWIAKRSGRAPQYVPGTSRKPAAPLPAPGSIVPAQPAPKPRRGETEIFARFKGKCAECERWFPEGERVFWVKGKPPRHVDCERARVEHEARELERKKNAETEAFYKLLDRLSAAKGSAGRRGVLTRAEEQIVTPELRLHLLLEASKLEADAALEKAEGLKLAMIKSDAVPDEMQAEQLAMLEEALRTLDAETEGKAETQSA